MTWDRQLIVNDLRAASAEEDMIGAIGQPACIRRAQGRSARRGEAKLCVQAHETTGVKTRAIRSRGFRRLGMKERLQCSISI